LRGSDSTVRAPSVALLLGNLIKEQPFLAGASTAAHKRGANLVCLVGKNLKWMEDHFFEGNFLYKLVDKERYDGVVTWAGTGVALGQSATEEEMTAFFQDLAPLPVVNYEKAIPGLHCVRTDTAVDMQLILRHLIVEHNRRKILLIRGPEHHFETEERIRAYHESLAAFAIPFDPALILPPLAWTDRDHARTIHGMIELAGLRPGIDFDAVAGTEYYFATHAIRVLDDLGINTPDQVAVIGFNDSPLNMAVTPTLTTMRKPFAASGARAVEIALDLAEGKEISMETIVPAELILRHSCGCVSKVIVEAGQAPGHPADVTLPALFSALQWIAVSLPTDWPARLWAAFESDLDGKSQFSFIKMINEVAFAEQNLDNTFEILHRVINCLRIHVQATVEGAGLAAAETLLAQGRMSIAEGELHAQMHRSVLSDHHHEALDVIGKNLSAIIDLDALVETMMQEFPRLGIPSCYFALYVDPLHPEKSLQVQMAYRDFQRITIEPGGWVIPSVQLVPAELLPSGRTYTLVVEPLFQRERQLGIIVFELGNCEASIFEVLQRQISSALDRILIEQEVREREAQFHVMAEAAPISIFLINSAGVITYSNPILREISQPGSVWFQDVDPDEAESLLQKWQAAAAAGQPFSAIARFRGADGQAIWLDVRMAAIEVKGKMSGYVGMALDVSERKRLEDHLYYLSMCDQMTGLFNRAFFDETLARLQLGDQRPISVLIIDVDGLKMVNDRQGHAAGDVLLRRMARLLKNSFRSNDLISRIGGDEFAVLLPGVSSQGLQESIQRIQRKLHEEYLQHGDTELRFSLGGATAQTGDSLIDIVQSADRAMYADKARRRNAI
jgi:diguanylate cyclase (GGDEF)-like protein/PAS domain S-box-containing protein